MRLGLLGPGGIGSEVARAVVDGRIPGTTVVGVVGRDGASASAKEVAALAGAPVVSVEGLVGCGPDWVLEAATGEALRVAAPLLLRAGIGVIVMSIGALMDDGFREELEGLRGAGAGLVLPSGAIGGLDAVRALALGGGLEEVGITSTKAPKSLVGAPYLEENGIELPPGRVVTVFEGSAREAVRGFPRNVNVSAVLSLAGVGPDRTLVRIVSDPGVTRSRHEIRARGSAGEVEVVVQSSPLASNPRTSALAALSAVQAVAEVARQANRGMG